ncbi:MAG: type II secretion system F family protein [Clostridia bacterium]|jgi:tight adherence protein B|nr:type II secretion system F family protein [Clostridia bacterium]
MHGLILFILPLVLALLFLGAGKKLNLSQIRPPLRRRSGGPDEKAGGSAGKEGLLDYRIYVLSPGEKILYMLQAAAFLFLLSLCFYHSLVLSALAASFALFYPRLKAKDLLRKRQDALNLQFRDALYALASSVSAGKSVEGAFKDAAQELYLLYPDEDTYIVREFTAIAARIEMNETVEEAIRDLAERSGLADIRSFADVFGAGKRSGGDMVEIISNTSQVIGEKLRIREEINTLLAQRKFEQKVMNAMPVVLLLLLTWSTGDYMAPVFKTVFGRLVMTVAVILLAAAWYISKRISEIEV